MAGHYLFLFPLLAPIHALTRVSPFVSALTTIAAFAAVAFALGAGFAVVLAWKRRQGTFPTTGQVDAGPHKALPLFGPNLMIMHRLHVAGLIGGVFALGIVTLAFLGLPEARWFILLAGLSGCVFGLFLRLLHR